MIGPAWSCGLLVSEETKVVNLTRPIVRTLSDPVDACVVAVAIIPVLALAAVATILWRPLGVVGLIVGVFVYPSIRRVTVRELGLCVSSPKLDRNDRLVRVVVVVGVAAAMSVPLTQVFFANDLRAMAAPTVATVEAGSRSTQTAVPTELYGSASSYPSYAMCEAVQGLATASVAWPCYSMIGYARLWQMRIALPTLICLLLLTMGFPLAVLWQVRSRV
jgi:hypothetical protein